jgi:3-hydroxyacyl-CoA dehydrogenase/enoyl-CoA hydratase/3-hydroxybutyryl-CoA epimerase
MGRSLEKALELEALAAGELIASRVSKNLIHVFNLREAARKGAGAVGAAPVGRIRQIGIVGAGTIGGGIAQLAAQRGIRVRLKDVRQEAISLALKHASGVLNSSVKRHKLSRWNADEAMGRISGGLDYAGFGPTGLVVEVVGERMEVTKAVLREIESSVSESCVIVTNTSSLSVTEMAGALNSPRRFAGMHFFNPVHRMPLVEIVQGEQTDRDIVAIVHALSVRLGKVPVVVRDGPGLLVNRILGPYLNEAGFLLAEGAGIDDIDGTAVAFGMPRGPLQLIDEIGIDIVRHTGQTLHNAFGDRLAPSPALLAIGESGRLGRKGGSGFYTYQNGQQFRADRTVHDLIGTRGAGAESAPDAEEISDRLVLSMINEAAGVLSDGVAFSAADVDFAMIMGTGFPSFRGGLLRLADEMHPQSLLERLEHYEKSCGARFSAAPLLRELARDDRGFYEAYPKGLPA